MQADQNKNTPDHFAKEKPCNDCLNPSTAACTACEVTLSDPKQQSTPQPSTFGIFLTSGRRVVGRGEHMGGGVLNTCLDKQNN